MEDTPTAQAVPDPLARWWLIPPVGATLAVSACLALAGRAGFPEDDGWIHQDFARTLALTGRFAFQPGRAGAGSTSPLWVLLLAPPHLLMRGQAPLWLVVGWAALLGGAALAGAGVLSGWAAMILARRAGMSPHQTYVAAALAGLAVVGQWQLIWAAVSGMETNLFALLALLLIVAAARAVPPFWLGLLASACVLARPEGALVALLVAGAAAWTALAPVRMGRTGMRRMPLRALGVCALGWVRQWLFPYVLAVLLCGVPYIIVNLLASGRLLPSTVYAKQAGVAVAGGTLARLGDYLSQMSVVLLVVNPVLVAFVALLGVLWLARALFAWRRSNPAGLVAPRANPDEGRFPLVTLLWLWPLALATAYASALPGAWQYGRYLMPILPPLLALLAVRLVSLLYVSRARALPFATVLLTLAALLSLVGASRLYDADVRAIDGYHVAVARWLRAHTSPSALVATHDIGAIGYFSQRRVVDFAGLADPELIPLLGNQAALVAALRQRHVDYVVMRPNWFPPPALLAHELEAREVYRACGLGECFVVYRTGW